MDAGSFTPSSKGKAGNAEGAISGGDATSDGAANAAPGSALVRVSNTNETANARNLESEPPMSLPNARYAGGHKPFCAGRDGSRMNVDR